MDQDAFSAEVDRALRRVRSTGDLDLEPSGSVRPTRHRSAAQRRSEGTRRSVGNARLLPARGFTDGSTDVNAAHALIMPPPAAVTRPRRFPTAESWDVEDVDVNGTRTPTTTRTRRPARRRPPRPVPPGLKGKVMVFFGIAGPDATARRQLLSLVWNLASGFGQFVIILTLLIYSSKHESPTMPGMNEWDACQKPLGVWNSIWLVRVASGSLLAYWTWRYEQTNRQNERRSEGSQDAETARSPLDGNDAAHTPYYTRRRNINTSNLDDEERDRPPVPHTRVFGRLSMFTNLLSLVWFMTAHVLEYTSVNSCRHSAPHLWWLTFGILCILYLMLLEIFLIGLLVFILGPVLYLCYNIVLLCLGRHPLQNPGQIKPDVQKIPSSIVDQIPLVLYIPTPPDEVKSEATPVTAPPNVHAYPPKPASQPVRKGRFAFFRRSKKAKKTDEKGEKAADSGAEGTTWEDNWLPGDYPFVRLEGHRAACAICLLDYDEPERKDKGKKVADTDGGNEASPTTGVSASEVQEVQVEEVTQAEAERLELTDAGEGPQPLRLLGCGHVFHKTCVDPWLIDVSGRCPICQRPVEVPDNKPKAKKGRRNRPSS